MGIADGSLGLVKAHLDHFWFANRFPSASPIAPAPVLPAR